MFPHFKLCLGALLSVLALMAEAQSTKKTYELAVAGNCEHCQDRIETALDQPGVKQVRWNNKTGIATITADSTKVNLLTLSSLVAKTGHDTKEFRASQQTYNKLPKCCRYTRDPDHKGKEIK